MYPRRMDAMCCCLLGAVQSEEREGTKRPRPRPPSSRTRQQERGARLICSTPWARSQIYLYLGTCRIIRYWYCWLNSAPPEHNVRLFWGLQGEAKRGQDSNGQNLRWRGT